MKDFIKFFCIITGLFRSIISILLLFAIGFIVFVDTNLLLGFIDILGYNIFSIATIKPIGLLATGIAFIFNTIISRNIFKSGENGKHHLSNIFFAIIFLAVDALLFLKYREKLIFILIAFNGLIFINSVIGLIAKFNHVYDSGKEKTDKKTEYIEVKSNPNSKEVTNDNIKIDFKSDKEEIAILKKDEEIKNGKVISQASQIITSPEEKNDDSGDKEIKTNDKKIEESDQSTDSTTEKFKESKSDTLIENSEDNILGEKKHADSTKEDLLEDAYLEGTNTEPNIEENPVDKQKYSENSSSKTKVLDDGLVITEKSLDDLKKKEKNPKHRIKKVNKTIKDTKTDQTYDPDLAEDFQKIKDKKIYDKSRFVRKDPNNESN